jgi:hypothetical protein
MKNYDEMYQSVLSKYEEYQEKKKKRIFAIKRTVPVLACLCFIAIIGLGRWNQYSKFPEDPIQPEVIETVTTETQNNQISSTTYSTLTEHSKNGTEIVTTAVNTSSTKTNKTSTTGKQQAPISSTVITETMSGNEIEQNTIIQTEIESTDPVVTTVSSVITEPITTVEIVEPTLKMPSVMVYDPFSPIVTEFTKMRANEAITLINEYNPNYTPDKEIGILFKFDSKECTIKVTTDHGEFWTLDKVKGKEPAEAVGKTYDIGNEGGIYWIPDELNENNDLESEILIMGEYNGTSVELGKITVTQYEKHTFRVILKENN